MSKKKENELPIEYYNYIKEGKKINNKIIGNDIWVENEKSKNSIEEDPNIIVNIFLYKNPKIKKKKENCS